MNIQNQPATVEFRNLYVAGKGHKLVVADMSSIEMRILAEFAQEELLLKAFDRGHDPHILAASLLENKSLEEVTKEERSVGKTFNYATLYRQTVFGLSKKLGVSIPKAESLQRRYKVIFRAIEPWSARVIGEARQSGLVRTVSGRLRYLHPHLTDQQFESTAVNTEIQGSAGDCMKKSMIIALPRLKKVGSKLIAQVHDELVVKVREEDAEETRLIVVDSLVQGHKFYLPRVKIEVDSHIVDRWGMAKCA